MKTIVDMVQLFRHRKKLAFIFKDGFRDHRWSYYKLYESIERFCTLLKMHNIKKGDHILIWGPNSPEWVIAYLGTICYGAVSVPVDMMANHEQAAMIAKHANVKLCIKTRYKKRLKPNCIIMEELEYILEDYPVGTFHVPDSQDLCMIVYTSGTTGKPKGVMMRHMNLVSNIINTVKHVNLGSNERMLSLLPLSHLFENTCTLGGSLYTGSTIIYLHTLKPSAIFKAFEENDVTIMVAVPRLLQSLRNGIIAKAKETGKWGLFRRMLTISPKLPLPLRKILFRSVHKKIGKQFRFFVSGGAALDCASEQFWYRLGFIVLQGYGLTETAPVLTANKETDYRFGSCGSLIPSVRLKIAQDGEVLAKGPNIFSGYYKDAKKTKTMFTKGWFRTEDIGYMKEGFLYLKGRMKDVIITKAGVNVYPEDIENILQEIPGVAECTVVGVDDSPHAVLIMESGADPRRAVDLANKRLNDSQQLLGYTIWHERELPKTPTKKIKKNVVREQIEKPAESKGPALGYSKIMNILSKVSPIPIERIKDNHLLNRDLKIDSIGRVELVSLIEREFIMDFEEELINQDTTVKMIKEMVAERKKGNQKIYYPGWIDSKIVRIVKHIFQRFLNIPLPKIWMDITVKGLSNLQGVRGPVFFVANHESFFDHPAILSVLPEPFRYRVSAPGKWEVIFERPKTFLHKMLMRGIYLYLIVTNGMYAMPEYHSFRKSLEYTGRRVNMGDNILIFPEGSRTETDEMLPLKKGTSLLVQKLKLPVVPIGIRGLVDIFPRTSALPKKRGKVHINFGKPIRFRNESLDEITERIRTEIDTLRKM